MADNSIPYIRNYFEDLKNGQTASITRTVNNEMVRTFAKISGDYNPVHLHDEFAAETPFGGRIAHGVLLVGFISAILGTKLPGPGVIFKQFSVVFQKPVYVENKDKLHIKVRVTKLLEKRSSGDVTLKATIRTKTELILTAIVLVSVPKKKVEIKPSQI